MPTSFTRRTDAQRSRPPTKIAIGLLCAAINLSGLLASASIARAQASTRDSVGVPDSLSIVATPTHADSSPPWVTKRELLGAGLSVLATIAVSPLDKPVANELQEARWQKDEPLHSASQAFAFAGGPGPFFLGAGFFAVGRITGAPALSDAGAHITEAVVLAAGITALGKGIAGRALPGVQTSESFEWARGFHRGNGPFVSFPSGHTAAGFAMASALTEEAGAWRPGLEHFVGPAAYLTASAIGLARLYQHVHWVSDLPLAAAIGTWSGLAVESHVHRRRRGGTVTRIVEAATVQRTSNGGTLIGMSIPFGGSSR